MIENLRQAYARWYNWHTDARKTNNRKKKENRVDMEDYFTMEGASHINLAKIPSLYKKKIRKVLTLGYTEAQAGQWPSLAVTIAENCAAPFKLGYIGKTHFLVWFHKDDVDGVMNHMKAQLVMTEQFRTKDLRIIDVSGDWKLVNAWVSPKSTYDNDTHVWKPTQLQGQFKPLKHIVDEAMALSLHRRQAALDMLTNEDTITLPFTL